MGAQPDKTQQFMSGDYNPPLEQYKLKHCGHNYYVWDHCMQTDAALIQLPINIVDQSMLRQQIELFMFRHRHPMLVSTLYFRQNPSGKASIFYERVFTNLSRIKDIPFDDTLQFYYAALKGFEQLYKRYGYFPIEQEMLHVTLNKKVKVWCHKDISKSKPTQSTSRGTQQDMVKKIIRIIEENSDNAGSHHPPVNAILYEQASSSFSAALTKLRELCFQNNLVIPNKLKCLDAISEGEIGSLLDEYGEFKESPIYSELECASGNTKLQRNLQAFKVQTSVPIPDVETRRVPIQSKLSRGDAEYSNNRDCSGPKQPRRNVKGLQVSLHLSDSKGKGLNESQDRNVCNKDSPIKSLDKQQTASSQLTAFEAVIVNRSPSLQRPSSQKIINTVPPHMVQAGMPYFGSHRFSLNNYARPIASSIPQRQAIVRKGSLGCINMNQPPTFNMRQPEYRVVINVANRPPSPGHHLVPQNNTLPEKQSNNFLSPSLPFPFTPSSIPNSSIRQCQKLNEREKINENIKIENKTITKPEISNGRQNQRPSLVYPRTELKHRDTFISNISSDNEKQPFKDYSNFKSRFEDYKKQFSVDLKNEDLLRKNTQNSLSRNEVKIVTEKKLNKKPFFAGILNTDTVNSYIESNGFCSQKKNISSHKSIKNDVQDFPSVTDVSDNVSYFPSKDKTENWREQSLVIKHDPNVGKISLPESKKYEPEIDSEIWADMLKVKNKMKYAVADLKV